MNNEDIKKAVWLAKVLINGAEFNQTQGIYHVYLTDTIAILDRFNIDESQSSNSWIHQHLGVIINKCREFFDLYQISFNTTFSDCVTYQGILVWFNLNEIQ